MWKTEALGQDWRDPSLARSASYKYITDRFILGLDFLMAHGCTVDAGAGSLRIGAEEVPLRKP